MFCSHSIDQSEWSTRPSCPNQTCSFNKGRDTEGTNSSKVCIWCLCICVFCFVGVGMGTGFVDWLQERFIYEIVTKGGDTVRYKY